MVAYRNFGEPSNNEKNDPLVTLRARSVLQAVTRHRQYELVEIRRLLDGDKTIADVLVVDCTNDAIGHKNAPGIKWRERLALFFHVDPDSEPEVLALREDFPGDLAHLGYASEGVPPRLCLHQQKWEAVARTWTPQKFLADILWWLTGTAKGTLHPPTQHVEQVYYEPAQKIILPPQFEKNLKDNNTSLALYAADPEEDNPIFLRGFFVPSAPTRDHRITAYTIALELSPVVHGQVERPPFTLGELDAQLVKRGSSLAKALYQVLRSRLQGRLIAPRAEKCLLVLSIPIRRSPEENAEDIERRAYFISANRCEVGSSLGVLAKVPDSRDYVVDIAVGAEPAVQDHGWRDLKIITLGVRNALTSDFSQLASGAEESSASFSGVLAGVGALGSALAEIWSRECWGNWTYVDHDRIEPHNLVRHLALDAFLGFAKAKAVKALTEAAHPSEEYSSRAIVDRAASRTNPALLEAYHGAAFWVDVTTTLDVPRSISAYSDMPRGCSAFVTPSGNDSVLLFEPAGQSIRLDGLEAQYYRAIINREWGQTHLVGHRGQLAIGAGCRDMSFVMSVGQIRLHASILARQIRALKELPEAQIRIWMYDAETGTVKVDAVKVDRQLAEVCRKWKVYWDAGVRAKLQTLREAKLPLETGGIILGYVDYVSHGIYVVDVLAAPTDSIEREHEFIRGVEGLAEARNTTSEKTAGIVDYIGEWHSHPRHCSPKPSHHDRLQQTELANELGETGQPLLTMIVGDSAISLQVTESAH
jgi:hypothetical protein